MKRFLPKPRGAWRVEQAYPQGKPNDAATPVLVSLCGPSAPWDGLVVEADPKREYDWTFLKGRYVAVVVRAGIDATPTVRALFPLVMPYLMLADADKMRTAAVMTLTPKLTAWQLGANGARWNEAA